MSAPAEMFIRAVLPWEGRAGLSWQDRALCQYVDPEIFFPEKGGSTVQAKRTCRGCEVRPECLEYVLENNDPFGIWGGFSDHERRDVTRQYRAGHPLADIIAEDEAAFYGRVEAGRAA